MRLNFIHFCFKNQEEIIKPVPKKQETDLPSASVYEFFESAPEGPKKKPVKRPKVKQHKHREHGAKKRKLAPALAAVAAASTIINHSNEMAGAPFPESNTSPLLLPTIESAERVNDIPTGWSTQPLEGKHRKEHSGKVKKRKNHGEKGEKPRKEKGKDKGDKLKKKHRKKKHLVGSEDQPRIKITVCYFVKNFLNVFRNFWSLRLKKCTSLREPCFESRFLFQIKPIMPGQYTAQLMSTQFESTSDPKVGADTNHTPARRNSLKLETEPASQCDKCCIDGTNTNLVRCDECRKCFHFHCLEPPLKKTPKKRGYSWHCADCDPTVYLILVSAYWSWV